MAESVQLVSVPSYLQLFQYASNKDLWLIGISVFAAILNGACLPFFIIFFGEVAESFTKFGTPSLVCDSDKNYTSCDGEIENNDTHQSILSDRELKYETLTGSITFYTIQSFVGIIISFTLHVTYVACFNISASNQTRRMKSLVLKGVLHREMSWHDIHSRDFTSQLTYNLQKIEESIGERLGSMIGCIASFLCCVCTAFFYGWKLTLIILTPLPILIGATIFLSKRQANSILKEIDANSKAMSTAKEVLESVRTVKAFNGQKKEIQSFQHAIKMTQSVHIRRSLLSGLEAGLWWFLTFLSYALAFWFGVPMISTAASSDDQLENHKEYTIASFNIIFFNVAYAGTKISQVLSLVAILLEGNVAATSIFQLIDQVPIKLSPRNKKMVAIQGHIDFDRIDFSYPSRPDVAVLRNISFQVPAGKVIALVGPSGCGKTSCIQLMQRFYDPDKGHILLDGSRLDLYDRAWLRSQIGVVGQEPVLFATSIKENILLGSPHYPDGQHQDQLLMKMKHITSRIRIDSFITSLPLGYDTPIGVAQLSGGQKQCIAIARALMADPKILLLDEPTSALDPVSESTVQEALVHACRGRTCFVIAHRMATIRQADIIIVLRNGEIVESGSDISLMNKKGLYYRLASVDTTDNRNHSNPESAESSCQFLQTAQSNPQLLQSNEKETTIQLGKNKETQFLSSLLSIIGSNRQLLVLMIIGACSSIITGLTKAVFAVLFGETLHILSRADPTENEIEIVRKKHLDIFLTIAVVAGSSAFSQSFTLTFFSTRLSLRLKISSYRSMLSQQMSWFDRPENNIGSLCTRLIADPTDVQSALGPRTGAVIQGASILVASLGIAFYYEWKLALVGSPFVAIILMASVLDSRVGMSQNSPEEKNALEESNRLANEAISNIRVVVAMNRQNFFYQRYKKLIITNQKAMRKRALVRGLVCALANNIDTLASVFFLYYGGFRVRYESISFESMFIVVEALIYGMDDVGKALTIMPNYTKAAHSIVRLNQLISSEKSGQLNSTRTYYTVKFTEDVPARDETMDGHISFEKIRFSYPARPDVIVLNQLDMIVRPGQTVALVGPSGSGKSTCIQLLEKFYDPDAGIIRYDGCRVSEMNTDALRSQLGLVGQEPVLFDRTISDNITYGGTNPSTDSPAKVIESARQANIHDWIQSLPLGYDTVVGYRGSQLSGGQKQRVAIARALYKNPSVLILDEAVSALDTESEFQVLQAIRRARVDRTCVIVSHRLSSIQNADHIFVMNNGSVQEQGNHQDLMKCRGLYYRLVMSEKGNPEKRF